MPELLQHNVFTLLCLALALPFLGGIVAFTEKKWAPVPFWIAVFCSGLLLAEVAAGNQFQFTANWLHVSADFNLRIGLSVDLLSATMATLVLAISAMIQVYSVGYFAQKVKLPRYFLLMGVFTSAMLLLVFSADLLTLTIGWNMVGVASYFLIGYYYEKPSAAKAATQALLINKLGDLFLLMGLIGIMVVQGSVVFTGESLLWPGYSWWIPLCLVLAALVKSAQFPFQFWLPDAMEGPTPVSALLHAATMVVAGVFLLIRVFPWLPSELLEGVSYIGVAGALGGSLLAFFHWDAKRVLAWSTVAQIGYMMAAIGFKVPEIAFLHLFTHAFFKAGLFLSAGISIHRAHQSGIHSQHLAHIGNTATGSEKWAFALLMAALMGMPLTTGFLSKEAILATGFGAHSLLSMALLMAGLLTGAYMGRYFFWAFSKAKNSNQQLSGYMGLPLVVFVASVLIPLGMAQYGLHGASLTFYNIGFVHVPAPEAPVWFTGLALALGAGGFALGYWLQTKVQPELAKLATVPTWASTGFYIHSMWQGLYRFVVVQLPSRIAWADWHVLDRILRASGKSVVVLGHLVAFLDNKLVDSLILLVAAVSRLGGRLVNSFQTASIQRNLAHLFIFILLFSWLVYQLVF